MECSTRIRTAARIRQEMEVREAMWRSLVLPESDNPPASHLQSAAEWKGSVRRARKLDVLADDRRMHIPNGRLFSILTLVVIVVLLALQA
jgi:hypothetical protein